MYNLRVLHYAQIERNENLSNVGPCDGGVPSTSKSNSYHGARTRISSMPLVWVCVYLRAPRLVVAV